MRNLRSYFRVIFASPEISDDNLRKFTEIHLQRLSADNPAGIFTPLIAATSTAYEAYFGNITDEATRFAVQRALTLTMRLEFDAFLSAVSRQEGRIRAEFDKSSPAYLEFYPQGVTEYIHATLANIETLMKRYADAATRYLNVLGQPFVDQFANHLEAFSDARQAQLLAIGQVKAEKTDTRGTRAAVEDQLMDNLLTLAMKFKRHPDDGMAFFDQSFIRREPEDEEEEPPAPVL